MADFKIIETQEQLDQVVKKRLERERAKFEEEHASALSELQSKLKALEEEQNAAKKSLEEMAEKDKEIDALKGQVKGYEMAKLRTKIALEYRIPYNLSDRIQGEDEESMKKDAENLATYFQKQEPIAPSKNTDLDKTGNAYQELLDSLDMNE